MQFICRGKLLKSTMWALVAAIGEFKEKEISNSIVKEEISRKKKQGVLFKLSPQVV